MIVIRPITLKDQTIFAETTFESLLGMTNLPRNREKLKEKILISEESFKKEVNQPGLEEYYFVIEDLTTERVGGTCGIIAQSTKSFTHYYQIEALATTSKNVFAPKEIKVLKVVPNSPTNSEICSLYLHPTFRHSGQGRLLSLSRFLFIAAHPNRFNNKIIANMRGYIDQRQTSPFWEGIGRHFCNLSFVELMAQLDHVQTFIDEILPQYSIYIDLLPKEVQEVVGKTHDNTKPAYQLLTQENFAFRQKVDFFEGGPILSADTSDIRSIKNSALVQIDVTTDPLEGETEFILGNEKLDFRACYGKLRMISKTHALINEEVANALLVKKNDPIRFVSLH